MTHIFKNGGFLPLPKVEKPELTIGPHDYEDYYDCLAAYNSWLSKLIKVPTEYQHLFVEGREYEEGVDFRTDPVFTSKMDGTHRTEFVAIPINQGKQNNLKLRG